MWSQTGAIRKISLLREVEEEPAGSDISMGETGHDADDTTQVDSGDEFAQTEALRFQIRN